MTAIKHDDGLKRCAWCGMDPLYVAYHDEEWGVPEYDSRALFEKLMLDGFQAGLSWITILRKRENFRAAFDGFNPEAMARYDRRKLASLMEDAGIVRNRAKIEASVTNAQAYLAIPDFSAYMWDFVGGAPVQSKRRSMKDVPAATPLAERLSKDLRKRGFNFCGPTIVYAFMQACGLVNDHLLACHRHEACRHAAQER
jgi:DNA-3-methyladenine glycosylase I